VVEKEVIKEVEKKVEVVVTPTIAPTEEAKYSIALDRSEFFLQFLDRISPLDWFG
jgi:hypothetical protein